MKSMTGYGKAQAHTKFGLFIAEIKTLNHKFLEITPKLPNSLGVFEDKVKGLIKRRARRGKVYFNLIHDITEQSPSGVFVDEKLAKSYSGKLKKLGKQLKIEGAVRLSDVIAFPGVVNFKTPAGHMTKMWPLIKKVINDALEELACDRAKEGAFLERDIAKRMSRIREVSKKIKKYAKHDVVNYKKTLSERIKELSGSYPMDMGRLEVEVALFAKNSDITEELTRLDNHMRNFSAVVKRHDEAGKKLDFIAQELHREANTMGAKSSGFNISKGVIEIKTDIEKIREQLKNIE